MTWEELNEARRKLGFTESQAAQLLAVGLSTYKGWGVRDKVPGYIGASMEAHSLLSARALDKLKSLRGI